MYEVRQTSIIQFASFLYGLVQRCFSFFQASRFTLSPKPPSPCSPSNRGNFESSFQPLLQHSGHKALWQTRLNLPLVENPIRQNNLAKYSARKKNFQQSLPKKKKKKITRPTRTRFGTAEISALHEGSLFSFFFYFSWTRIFFLYLANDFWIRCTLQIIPL